MMPSPAIAGKEGVVRGAEMSLETVAPKLALWFTLFVTSAAFHSAEIAITTLYPWKVKEFAEEEGENSPFQVHCPVQVQYFTVPTCSDPVARHGICFCARDGEMLACRGIGRVPK